VDRRFALILMVGLAFVAVAGGAVVFLRPAPAPVAEPPAPAAPAPAPEAVEPPPSPPPSPPPATIPPRAEVRPAAPAPAPAAAPTTGSLHIEADVPAQVFVDRRFLGDAPVNATGLAPGTHQLNVTAEGYEGISRPVEVEAGSHDLQIRFKEVRLDAAIDVIHDHRIGSCRGRLIATPRALTYETDNTNDAFSVPLTSLTRFEVDYVKKTLTVGAKGKTYNFTDPHGSADTLFVFHRDVDKARQRLIAGDPPAKP
jgi:hypothetical protein